MMFLFAKPTTQDGRKALMLARLVHGTYLVDYPILLDCADREVFIVIIFLHFQKNLSFKIG